MNEVISRERRETYEEIECLDQGIANDAVL